jgi:3-phosphoshikimate 1-carboxyvinyltransferase
VLAAFCDGVSVIKGTSRLVAKESNRAEALVDVFTKMGVNIYLNNDELHVTGNGNTKPAIVSSHHDHRIAMACAIAALRSTGTITIHDAEAVNKSYPAFFDHLKMLGASVSLSG